MGPFDKSPSPIPIKKPYHHSDLDSLPTASQKESITRIIEKFNIVSVETTPACK